MARLTARKQKYGDLLLNRNEFLVLFYRNHPCVAAYDLFGVRLNALQRIALRDIWFRQNVMMVWGRGVSKTFILAIAAALFGLLYPGIKVGIFGPSLRQAGFVFEEIRGLHETSPYLKAAINGKVSMANYACRANFHKGGFIEALPTGDPGKIRGRRFQVMMLDEFAQLKEKTCAEVLTPFLAIMKEGRPNKLIRASSAYYKYNHLWPEFVKQTIRAERRPDRFALTVFNYLDVMANNEYYYERGEEPPYEFDLTMVEDARFMMTEAEFKMEWMALFPDVEEGFIPAHLIDECTPTDEDAVDIEFSGYDEKGNPLADYVLGLDPAWAEGGDNCAFEVGKLLPPQRVQIVRSKVLNGASLPEIADMTFKFAEAFPLMRIMMDVKPAGGGTAIRDFLSKPFKSLTSDKVYTPIVDVDCENPPDNARKILIPFNPTKPENHRMANAVKRRMEKRPALLEFPLSIRRVPGNEKLEEAYLDIVGLKTEIKVLQAIPKGELFTFKVPGQYNKDRWSALCLMVSAADELQLGTPKKEEPLGIGNWV